jgi:hypothetical protein
MNITIGEARARALLSAVALSLAGLATQVTSAADFTVTNADSTGPGSFDQALRDVNQAGIGPHRVLFDAEFFAVERQISIDGRYSVVNEFSIEGPGKELLTVVVQPRDPLNAAVRDLFFGAWAGDNPPLLFVEGMTIRIGQGSNVTKRLFFLTNIDLYMTDVHLDGNLQPLTRQSGNAIVIQDGSLSVEDSVITNFVADWSGGAVYVNNRDAGSEQVLIQRTVLSGNTARAGGNGFGGSLYVESSGVPGQPTDVRLIDCEVSDSLAETTGGGVWVAGVARLIVHNSTISSNSALNSTGGGIFYAGDAPLDIQFSTIADNHAPIGPAIDTAFRQDILITNSVVALNTRNSGPEIVGFVRTAHSLLGSSEGDIDRANTVEMDRYEGTLILEEDPMIRGLADFGGDSRTHAPMSGSPLLDVGDGSATPVGTGLTEPRYDQRGLSFDRVSGTGLDIGSHELQVATAPAGSESGDGGGGGGSASIGLLILLLLARFRGCLTISALYHRA